MPGFPLSYVIGCEKKLSHLGDRCSHLIITLVGSLISLNERFISFILKAFAKDRNVVDRREAAFDSVEAEAAVVKHVELKNYSPKPCRHLERRRIVKGVGRSSLI